jgi:hypothetical protein
LHHLPGKDFAVDQESIQTSIRKCIDPWWTTIAGCAVELARASSIK